MVITRFLFSIRFKTNSILLTFYVFVLYALSIFPNVSTILSHTLNNKSTYRFTVFILIQEFRRRKEFWLIVNAYIE